MTGIDTLLERTTPEVRDTFVAAAALVRGAMPDATEQLDLPDRLLAFGFGPPDGIRLRDFAVGLIPHARHVNIQLADGALLDDPTGIIEGTGKRIRHVKCHRPADVARPALKAIIAEQVARRSGSLEGRP
jgi:hypothetical protein